MAVYMGKEVQCSCFIATQAKLYRYSRRIMWTKVAHSNNNPDIIAQHYLECVEAIGGKYIP